MKISNDTIDELFAMIEAEFSNAELQKILLRFEITGWQGETTSPKTIAKSIPYVQKNLNNTPEMERFVQHALSNVKKYKEKALTLVWSEILPLSECHPKFYNSLLRDGYKVTNFMRIRS